MALIIGNIIGIPAYSIGGNLLPSCVRDIAISWYKNLDTITSKDEILEGLLDFNGINDSVFLDSIPVITGNATITLKLYITDITLDSTHRAILNIGGNNADKIMIYLYNNVLQFYAQDTSTNGVQAEIIENTILNISITKTAGSITNVNINNIIYTDSIVSGTTDSFLSNQIGGSNLLFFGEGYIWDINLNDIHSYLGYPNGNLESAWVDQIGSLTTSINGTPSTTSIITNIDVVKDQVGSQTRDIYYGQYLTNSSGQINFYRTGGTDTFDYTDPSDGSFVEGVTIPASGLYTIPANGICDIGVYPRVVETAVAGILDFDGINDYVELGIVPDVTGIKTISFNLFIKDQVISSVQNILHIGDGSSDDFIQVRLNDNVVLGEVLQVGVANSLVGKQYDLTSLKGEILEVVITKGASTVTSVVINDITETSIGDFSAIDLNAATVGLFNTGYGSGFYIWNLNINDEYTYSGQPNGNTDAAWVDQLFVNNSTVTGNPTTRTVTDGPTTVEGVMVGNSSSIVELNGSPDISGDKNIQFKLYLDKDSGYSFDGVATFVNTDSDFLRVYLDSNFIYFFHNNDFSSYNRYYDITGLDSQILEFSITKDALEFTDISLNGGTITTVDNSGISLSSPLQSGVFSFGYSGGGEDLSVWDVEIYDDPAGTNELIHSWVGHPEGNTDAAWKDIVYAPDGTVYGTPTTADIEEVATPENVTYTSFYPVCEGAGTVLHDTENGFHISVATPDWDEELYGSDYLNQTGYVTKSDSDNEGYDWTTDVDGTPIVLNDNTLIPLKKNDSLAESTLDTAIDFTL